jgi:hypothetical protein
VPNEFGLQRPSANGRPAPTKGLSPASAEADARRAAPEKADFNRREQAACVPNEFGLQRPSANGRPAPTEGLSPASAKADARRAAPEKADFKRREGLRPTIGLCAE